MEKRDLTAENWREYDWNERTYRIHRPVTLFYRKNGTTNRVLDNDGIVHCVPAPGHFGCVVRWDSSDKDNPVAF